MRSRSRRRLFGRTYPHFAANDEKERKKEDEREDEEEG